MTEFPALTVWQPWASLISAGAKPYEWRGWAAPQRMVGRRIAIHAGARPVRRSEIASLLVNLDRDAALSSLVLDIAMPLLERWHTSPGLLPLSSILCTVVLGHPITASRYVSTYLREPADSDRIDHTKWGWPLSQIERVEPFVPAKGMQGFWTWRSGDV